MHAMLKVAVMASSLGLLSTGFAAEHPATTTQAASTQTTATTPATPTNDQVLKGNNAASQPTNNQTALTQDHGGNDEDMD